MFCTRCGHQISEETARYCSQCGQAMNSGTPWAAQQRLYLDKRNKKIAGVCAGFARYFEVDVILVRVLWLICAFGTGVGFIAYLVAWIAVPKEPEVPVIATMAHPQPVVR